MTKQNGEGSNSVENILEKGEVEATKECEKEKNKASDDTKSKDENESSESTADKEKTADGNEQEVVFIQDMGFVVKIVSPGAEPFDIQVSSMELVQVNIVNF